MKKLLQLLILFISFPLIGQHSIARQWNEVLLEGIRNDFARPTVHARNLFHVSAAMYDAWALTTQEARPYLIGNTVRGYMSSFTETEFVGGQTDAEIAMSYAAYRMIEHRFALSPGTEEIMQLANQQLVTTQGLDASFSSTDYTSGSPAALGNYIAQQYITYGLQDGANESGEYENQFYVPVNEPLNPESPGNPNLTDPNRWQPLAFDVFIDQSGNEIPGEVPDFLSPEWGQVAPFSLSANDANTYNRDDFDYIVYHDPGPPPYMDPDNGGAATELYQWGFSMVSVWSGHLDTEIDKIIDISPGSIGNIDIENMPTSFEDYEGFYKYVNGGDIGTGYTMNPATGQPYEEQLVQLGDYGRVLAEFWADGPDSETPPGHWFTILNYVNDHPDLVKRFGGAGEILENLEWDVKSYFLLGGAMHDVAITAWGIKGYYDYIRPVSAIRYMAEKGQSSDPELPNYDVAGIPLVEGYIELVQEGDPLLELSIKNLNKIKLWAWKGHEYIQDPETDVSGVGWILAENWWPYQRPSFVTPPFAGYVSGHSTYSRAAAELLTLITGDPYFPGGMGEFEAPANEFLVFEDGPSENLTLQWATYRDASDQCSLSRIWGGIHPPADDIPGRFIGEEIGKEAFSIGVSYFDIDPLALIDQPEIIVYPNPTAEKLNISIQSLSQELTYEIKDLFGRTLQKGTADTSEFKVELWNIESGTYLIQISDGVRQIRKLFRVR